MMESNTARNNMLNNDFLSNSIPLNNGKSVILNGFPDKISENVLRGTTPLFSKSLPYRAFKRIFDIVMALVALILLAPIFLIVSLLIILEDGKNPLFSQVRMTKDKKVFKMYKFRSMCIDAEEKLADLKSQNEVDGPVFKMSNDPRVTRVGRFIRRTSIDELPQLINIIKGDMSIVGPRPPLPNEVEQYDTYESHRLDIKSGLTCYWQCSGRNNLSFEKWIELDIKYIREQSVRTDIKIIFMTVGATIGKRGVM